MEPEKKLSTIATIQNESGSSQRVTKSLQSASKVINSVIHQETVTSNINQNQVASIKFENQLKKCLENFKKLGLKLEGLIEDNFDAIVAKLNLPKIWNDFKGLPWWGKVLVVLGVAALCLLSGTCSWVTIQYVWPKFMDYINSSRGSKFAEKATKVLEFVNTCGAVEVFSKVLQFASVQLSKPSKEKKEEDSDGGVTITEIAGKDFKLEEGPPAEKMIEKLHSNSSEDIVDTYTELFSIMD